MNAISCDLHAETQTREQLPIITARLLALDYENISHQRISRVVDIENINVQVAYHYQGLTRAQHAQFGAVMIKWSLSCNSNSNSNYNNKGNNNKRFAVSQECHILNQLYTSLAIDGNTLPLLDIAPPVLACNTLNVQSLHKPQQLSMLVMPYYEGGSLAHWLNNKSCQLSMDKTMDKKKHVILQAAQLISILHQYGWLHNDIKPSNILIHNHTLLLTDFALAECIDNNMDKSIITAAGTPAYLAPERWQGLRATCQSDIYAFGIMMYEILMGVRPFKVNGQRNNQQLSNQHNNLVKNWAIEHCQQRIPSLPKPYQQYQIIINKALAKRLERRYQNMEEVLMDLEDSHSG